VVTTPVKVASQTTQTAAQTTTQAAQMAIPDSDDEKKSELISQSPADANFLLIESTATTPISFRFDQDGEGASDGKKSGRSSRQ